MTKDEALEILEQIEENVNVCCATLWIVTGKPLSLTQSNKTG